MALTQPKTKLSCITTSSYVHICKNKKIALKNIKVIHIILVPPSTFVYYVPSHITTHKKKSILFSIIMQRLSEMLQIMANYSVKKPKDVQSSFFKKNH